MPRPIDQRYVPTDVRSQIIHFLWSIGFAYQGPRNLMADIIVNALKEQQCESENSTSLPSASPAGR
jgi:hypothetical protein